MALIVAEISGNHDGSLEKAQALIVDAAMAGCDFVKFQYYKPEDMPDADRGDNWNMYERLQVPKSWFPSLFKIAGSHGIGLFASVFSVRAVNELRPFKPPFYKFASLESTRLPEKTYVDMAKAIGGEALILQSCEFDLGYGHFLYCPEGHPPPNIQEAINYYNPDFYYGVSDHTPDLAFPVGCLMAGARLIEKHFKGHTFRDDDCVDAAFSADYLTMKTLCRIAHNV